MYIKRRNNLWFRAIIDLFLHQIFKITKGFFPLIVILIYFFIFWIEVRLFSYFIKLDDLFFDFCLNKLNRCIFWFFIFVQNALIVSPWGDLYLSERIELVLQIQLWPKPNIFPFTIFGYQYLTFILIKNTVFNYAFKLWL